MKLLTRFYNVFEVRDWRTSKYPLRMIARLIFLTYMWSGLIQLTITKEYQRSNEEMVANGFEYLTFLGFLGTTLTVLLSALHEFVPSMKALKIGCNGVMLVVECMVTLLYWGLYLFKRDLILDKNVTDSVGPPPLFMDTAGHLMPFLAMIAEFMFSRTSKRHLYEQRVFHVIGISVFTFGYFSWIMYLFRDDGKFPYPFLTVLSNSTRFIFAFFTMFMGFFVYGIASRAYLKYHATEDDLPVYEEEFYEDEEDI